MPPKNMMMAMALIICITFKLKFIGLFGSFFLKKYITQIYIKKESPPSYSEGFLEILSN